MNTLFGIKGWPNLIQLMVEDAMREKQRPGNNVPKCLSFRKKKITANRKDCLMMLHMLMGSIHLSSGNWFKTNLFLYIIIFRSQNLCDSNSILENCCGKNACKTSGKCFS